ncbi:MAG: SHD1 domain-containing protein, partial [Verrucomicrobiota bacterium]
MKRSIAILGMFLAGLSLSEAENRTWKDSSGKFEIQAEFVRVEGTQVVLKSAEGRELKVELSRLSAADRAVAAELNKPETPSPAAAPSPAPSNANGMEITTSVEFGTTVVGDGNEEIGERIRFVIDLKGEKAARIISWGNIKIES